MHDYADASGQAATDAGTADGARQPWYVTTAIPYVNARPHIGFALEAVLTDALARYHRLRGEDVRFLTGTDENSLKNVQAAELEGIPTAELVERYATVFHDLRDALDLSFDDFIRTSSDPRHAPGVAKLWTACAEAGDLYRKSYRGLYCVGCEQFYEPSELIDGLCPEHRTPPEEIAEENWFFRLSRYQDELLARLESGELQVVPEKRRNEVVSFVRRGLEDFSVSRTRQRARGWGVPVPGDADQVVYVWFDALGNYITALDYAVEGALYRRYWLDNPNRVHVIGKGITRFHAIYWPAMLLSAQVPLPSVIFVHGYVTIGGEKVSKSLANVVDPFALTATYGTDQLRYFLLRHIRSTDDGDFTLERFVLATNADLANQLGNLLNRTVSMVGKYFEGVVPPPAGEGPHDAELVAAGRNLGAAVDAAMEAFAPHDALGAIWAVVEQANKYVVAVEPWTLAKTRQAGGPAGDEAGRQLATAMYTLVEVLRLVGVLSAPFMPASAAGLLAQIGCSPDDEAWPKVVEWGGLPPHTRVQPGAVLFPRLELPATVTDATLAS